MLIKIAWRNIWRNKKRSFIIIGAVTVGLWAGIFLMAFYNGMIEQRIHAAITREISHLQIHHPDFIKDYDVRYVISSGTQMLNALDQDTRIKKAAGRVILNGMIASANGSSGITINGIDPSREKELTGLKDKMIEGKYFEEDKTNEILVSEKTLKKLKLKLNRKAILTFQDKEGNLASAAFRVNGIFRTINTPYDERNVFVDQRDIDSLAGIHHEINEIAILLQDNERLDEVQQKLSSEFSELLVRNWKEISPELSLTVSAGDRMVVIFMGIIMLALAFGIINTMMMAILERARELGVLIALGMNKLRIFGMVLLETTFLILAGCPSGILLALLSIMLTRKTGINLSRYSEVYGTFGYDSSIYPSLTGEQFITVMILVLITAIVSSLFPARKALNLNPASSIKK
jgi:ABC-type lipoprotein release transport system permease subunit